MGVEGLRLRKTRAWLKRLSLAQRHLQGVQALADEVGPIVDTDGQTHILDLSDVLETVQAELDEWLRGEWVPTERG